MRKLRDTAKPRKASVLGPTLKFKGALSAEEDLVVEGSIEGSIEHTSRLSIGESGRIKADVSAEHVDIAGFVEGDIRGAQSITIRETANIRGNISSPSVAMLAGATINGNVDMSGKASGAAEGDDTASPQPASPGAAAKSAASG
jgi:cytoskeletal protein CcmA (bactofilin family)